MVGLDSLASAVKTSGVEDSPDVPIQNDIFQFAPVNSLFFEAGAGDTGSLPSEARKLAQSAIAYDSFFFSWPKLDRLDAFRVYQYQFVAHNGDGKPILTMTLPLMPQSISISVPTAAVTTVTMGGLSEEHNGAPLRPITISGSTGIRPRTSVDPFSADNFKSDGAGASLLQYAFANTIAAAQKAQNTASKIANNLTSSFSPDNLQIKSPVAYDKTDVKGSNAAPKGTALLDSAIDFAESALKLSKPSSPSIEGDMTSYIIAHKMMRFFDWYLAAKKAGNKKLLLTFCMNKDRMFYDVTLNGYSIRKPPGSLEYEYSVNMTAWRRREQHPGSVDFAQLAQKKSTGHTETTGNIFAQISLALQNATTLMGQIGDILTGITNDIDATIIGPVKQLGLLVAASTGLASKLTLNNFSKLFAGLATNSLMAAYKNSLNTNAKQKDLAAVSKFLQSNNLQSKSSSNSGTAALTDPHPASPLVQVSLAKQANGQADSGGSELDPNKDSSPLAAAMAANGAVFNQVAGAFTVGELNLSDKLKKLADDEINAALQLKASDVQTMRDSAELTISTISEALGGGDPDYNRILGRQAPKTTQKLTVESIVILANLNEVLNAMDNVINLLQQSTPTSSQSYVQFYAQYAKTQGIDFQNSVSKFYIPFPFGASLESLAVQQLGDVSRWIEIAAINGLKAPYVDEIGFQIPLKTSGSGSSVSVSTVQGLYVGQIVSLQSDTQRPDFRKVKAIEVITSVDALVFLSGTPDLGRFRAADNAFIHAFLPNTVNSDMLIAIPSTVPVNIPGSIRTNPDEADLNAITLLAKADFALVFDKGTGMADISFSAADVQIARGMQNLTQAAAVKVLTNQGELIDDPTFGNPVQSGSSVAGLNATKIISDLSRLFAADPRFTGVLAGRVNIRGPAATVDLLLGVTGSASYLPFTSALPLK